MGVSHWLLLAMLACGGDPAPPAPPAPEWQQLAADWEDPDPLPPFVLTDHQGQPLPLAQTRGDPLLIGFIYTRCPVDTACPMTMRNLVAASEALPELTVLALTFDPEHDTPPRLAAFRDKHGAHFPVATGPSALMAQQLPAMFNILVLPDAGQLDHTVKIVLLDADGRLVSDWKDSAFSVQALRSAIPAAP